MWQFLRVAKLMQEYWEDIQNIQRCENSLSPITYINEYNAFLNSDILMCNLKNININEAIIKQLTNCIDANLQQEKWILLQIIRDLDLFIDNNSLISILNSTKICYNYSS
jgi:hypothetical protein